MGEKYKEESEKQCAAAYDNAEVPIESSQRGWVVALVATISLARISHGLFLSITGPTLLFLADNTNSDVLQVSTLFSGRSVGILAGAVFFGFISNRFPTFKPLLSLGLGLGLNGVVIIITPFLTSLAALVTATMIGGLSFGYLNSGMQAVYLRLWGQEGSRPYIQSFHFGFSIGALLAPVIAAPFLAMANAEGDSGTTCPSNDDIFTTPMTLVNETTTAAPTSGINPICWSYIIIGAYTLLMSLLLCVLALCKVETRVASHNIETTESRPEEPLKDLWVFFLALCLYYFCCVSSETLYQGYIYSVALCSDLGFTPEQASLLTAMFSTGFGIGRGLGIPISNFIKPSTIIIADLIGTTTFMTIMCIWGEQSAILTWIVTFLHGFAVATFFSSGISWTSQRTNMAGTYIFVFSIGGTVGMFAMMPAGGALFEQNPFSVMYLIVGSCVMNIVAFVLMNFIMNWREKRGIGVDLDASNDEYACKSNKGYENDDAFNTT